MGLKEGSAPDLFGLVGGRVYVEDGPKVGVDDFAAKHGSVQEDGGESATGVVCRGEGVEGVEVGGEGVARPGFGIDGGGVEERCLPGERADVVGFEGESCDEAKVGGAAFEGPEQGFVGICGGGIDNGAVC